MDTDNYKKRRYFSHEFKQRQVELYDRGLLRVADICREFGLSRTAVYNWLKKYSKKYSHNTRTVIEMDSEAHKNRKLRERVAELERALGRKQMKIDYLEKLIEISSEQLGTDIEKKAGLPPLSGSGTTGEGTPGK